MTGNAPTLEDMEQAVLRRAIEYRLTPVGASVDHPIEVQDDEIVDFLEELGGSFGTDTATVFADWPVERASRSAPVMHGLQLLAPLWPRAERLLREATFRPQEVTSASIAASFRAGHFVPSGVLSEPMHKPISLCRGLWLPLAWWMSVGAFLALISWLSCDASCRRCGTLADALLFFVLGAFTVLALPKLAMMGAATVCVLRSGTSAAVRGTRAD